MRPEELDKDYRDSTRLLSQVHEIQDILANLLNDIGYVNT